jgi:hypothetical protein
VCAGCMWVVCISGGCVCVSVGVGVCVYVCVLFVGVCGGLCVCVCVPSCFYTFFSKLKPRNHGHSAVCDLLSLNTFFFIEFS